jgi:hypothetical protein
MQQEDLNLSATLYQDEYQTFIYREDPLTVMTSIENDTMYWDEAMRQPDALKFYDAAIKEIESHNKNTNWKIVPIKEVSKGMQVLDYV